MKRVFEETLIGLRENLKTQKGNSDDIKKIIVDIEKMLAHPDVTYCSSKTHV